MPTDAYTNSLAAAFALALFRVKPPKPVCPNCDGPDCQPVACDGCGKPHTTCTLSEVFVADDDPYRGCGAYKQLCYDCAEPDITEREYDAQDAADDAADVAYDISQEDR